MMRDQDYPYTGYEQPCKYQASAITPVRPTGFAQVERNDVTALKTAISTGGPVSALVEADRQVFRLYQRGILDTDKCGFDADHSVAIVGWGRDFVNRIDYWIVKNSWGTTWGEQGYFQLAQANNECGVATAASYPTGASTKSQ